MSLVQAHLRPSDAAEGEGASAPGTESDSASAPGTAAPVSPAADAKLALAPARAGVSAVPSIHPATGAPAGGAGRTEASPRAAARRGPFRPERLAPVRSRVDGGALRRGFRTADRSLLLVGATTAALAAGPAPWLQPLGAAAPVAGQAVAALCAIAALEGYRFGRREPKWLQPLRLSAAVGAAWAVGLWLAWRLPGGNAREAAVAAGVTTLLLPLTHAVATLRLRRLRRQGRLTPNVVVVGATPDAGRLIARALETREINVLGVFDDRGERAPRTVRGVPVLGDTAALMDHRLLPYVDRVVIAISAASQRRTRALAERLRLLPNAVTLFVDMAGEEARADALARLGDAPLSSSAQTYGRRAAAKRTQDLVIATLAFAVLAPVMLAVALAVRLDSPGPILFRQRRYGFHNEPIVVLKFRSMRVDAADPTAARQVATGDERVTRVGRLIRMMSLDELPQLANVIGGEMSLVGPRPHAIGMKTAGADTRALVAEYAWRHRMKPGLTGWAQVNGSRGPVSTPEDVRRRVALDLEYMERQSFWLDAWIMLRTLPRLLGDSEAAR